MGTTMLIGRPADYVRTIHLAVDPSLCLDWHPSTWPDEALDVADSVDFADQWAVVDDGADWWILVGIRYHGRIEDRFEIYQRYGDGEVRAFAFDYAGRGEWIKLNEVNPARPH